MELKLNIEKMTLKRFVLQKQTFESWKTKPDIIQALQMEHYQLRRAHERTSPILTIQKTWRGYWTRKRYLRKRRLVKILYWALNRYYKRIRWLKFIAYNKKKGRITTRKDIKEGGAARLIQRTYRKWHRE